MAPSTHLAYQQGLKAFDEFCNEKGIAYTWPIQSNIIMHFIAHLSLAGKSVSTAKTYLAGISSKHKLNGWNDPTDTFMIRKLLQGFARSVPQNDTRCPITFHKLLQLIPALDNICSNKYETLLFTAAFTAAFFGFFRISEMIGKRNDTQSGLEVSDVKILTSSLKVKLRSSKTDQIGRGEIINMASVLGSPTICPVQSLSRYLDVRPKSAKKLFVHRNGSQLTRYQFQMVLKKASNFLGWQPNQFSSHSFRIGAATTAAMNRMSESWIMKKGRWKSGAVKSYFRVELV